MAAKRAVHERAFEDEDEEGHEETNEEGLESMMLDMHEGKRRKKYVVWTHDMVTALISLYGAVASKPEPISHNGLAQ